MSKIEDLLINPHNHQVITMPNWAANSATGGLITFASEKHYYQPMQMIMKLVTDATVISRFVRLKFYDKSGKQMFEIGDNASITAGTTAIICAIYDYGGMTTGFSGSATNSRAAALPHMMFTRGDSISINTVNGQAGDLYSLFHLRCAVIPKEVLKKVNHV